MPVLTIDDDEAFAALEELAERQGKSVASLVLDLAARAREDLEQMQPGGRRHGLAEKLNELGTRSGPLWTEPWKSTPHGDLLYDDFGLPT